MGPERIEKARQVFVSNGMVAKTAMLTKNKFCGRDIAELISTGYIERIRTGYFVWISAMKDFSDIELAAAVIPYGVVCLHSAAAFYDFSTVIPTAVCIAIPFTKKAPVLPKYPRVELYQFEGSIFDIGITEVKTTYSKMRIYDKERVACDFFRMRLKLGEDIALEILQNYMRGQKNIQRLYEYSELLRIKNVIKPYVEALL